MAVEIPDPADPNKTITTCLASNGPIRYFSGEVMLSATDLSSGGFGMGWSHTRYFTNRMTGYFDRGQGWNWNLENWPYLVPTSYPGAPLALLGQAYSIDWFAPNPDGSYTTLYGRLKTLVHDAPAHLIRMQDADGTVYTFNDFSHATRAGAFVSVTTPGGNTTEVINETGSDILEVQRSYQEGTSTVTESYLYDFITSGDHAAHLESVTLRRRTDAGPWQNVRKATYTYYGSADSHGSLNDLKTAVRFEWSGSAWTELDTSYYRYWKDGAAHLVKFALGPQAFARLAADVSDPLTASDATVAQYADYYFEYDASRFVTRELVEGGSREFSFAYSINPHYVPNQPEDFNFWMRKTVETLPDGSKNIVFCNDVGLTMLKVFESGSDRWYTFNYYDGVGRAILSASSSAITGYDENLNDLLGLNSTTGLFQYLRDDAGLIYKTEYYATTGGGAAAGYLKARYLLKGQLGTPVKLTDRQYGSHTAADGVTVHPVTKSIAYRNDDGSGAIETSYAHTWHVSGGLVTNQVLQQTTTLPVVPTTQNGSGTADTADEVFDLLGYRTWSRDPRGFITKFEYDPETGAMTRRIDDVDTAQVTPPAGWSTPAGGGLHLVTDYEHDDQGRITQTLGPVHEVDLNGTATPVRTADWTVYKDAQNRTLSARGYQKVSDGTFTLVNPVSITVTDRNGNVREEIAAVRENTAGKLSPSDTFSQASYVRWTTHQYSDCCKLVSTRVYHTIPVTGEGASGTNYDQTDFGYDVRDRRNRVVSPGGTITFTVFDARSLPAATYIGTNDDGATEDDPTGGGADPNNNMIVVTESIYDDGTAGGDGNLTQATRYVSATDTRVTAFLYDWRNRRTATDGELDFYETLTYDNLDRVIRTDRYDTTASGNLIARSETLFDDRGRVYRTKQYAVDPAAGTVGNALIGDNWFDADGNVIKNIAPGANQLATKTVYDGLNRSIIEYSGYDVSETDYADAGDVSGDTILEQVEMAHDSVGNVITMTKRQRYHTSTGTGPLNGPTGVEPKARVTYVASWSDAVGRTIALADYGTNGGTALSRPATVPARSDSVLVTSNAFDDAGRTSAVTDPAGTVTVTEYDDADRRTKLIENFIDGVVSAAAPDEDRTTRWTYTADGNVATLTAVNPATGDQVTTYVHGTTLADSDIATSNLLRRVKYPDSTGDADSVEHKFNRQSERTETKDQIGTVHAFDYDKLGRPTQDRVTALGIGVDGAVRRIATTYEVRGLPETVTSYDNASVGNGNVVNEVLRAYDNFGQLAEEYQSHSGAVNIATTPKVGYSYANGSANTIRPATVVYPNGRTLVYGYDSGVDRVTSISDSGVSPELVTYAYLGLGSFVEADVPQPDLKYTLVGTAGGTDPDTGDIYRGLDRFGRVKDAYWRDYGSNTDAARLKYGYDRVGNRAWREDAVAVSQNKNFDELYAHDGLYRLGDMRRGRLNGGKDAITNLAFRQDWGLDATGNWTAFDEDANGDGSWDLVQSRSASTANEVSGITNTTGSAWAVPAYDAAGNMTMLPQPAALGQSYSGTYDAWNRLVKLAAGANTVQENAYDAINRRTIRQSYSAGVLAETQHQYYSNDWQLLEERLGSSAAAERQFVWGMRYIDDLLLRDRDTDGNGTLDERLYALQDANWNVVALADATGSLVERDIYAAYGEPKFLTAAYVVRATSAYKWDMLYAGYQFDGTGLCTVRNRVLHPSLGEWITRDPAGYTAGDLNLYAYLGGHPEDSVDPLGNSPAWKVRAQRRARKKLKKRIEQHRKELRQYCFYDALKLDSLFDKLLNSLEGVRPYHATFSQIGSYGSMLNELYYPAGTSAESVNLTLIYHELTHATDDFSGWYLNDLPNSLLSDIESSEALAYSVEHLFNNLRFLENFAKKTQENVSCESLGTAWSSLWGNLGNPAQTDVYYTYYRWPLHRELTPADIADAESKLGFDISCSALAKACLKNCPCPPPCPTKLPNVLS